jgi:transcriptional regulator with XRE-family HTH domain
MPTPKELKRRRLAAGLTQRQLAVRLKVTAAHIAYLEHGRRSPSATLIRRYLKLVPR